MKRNSILGIATALCLSATPLLAQDKPVDNAAKKEHRAEMAEMHKKMLADMKQENADLQKAVEEMNKATGEQKVNAIAGVVSKMAAIHQSHVQRMEAMHEKWAEWKKTHQQKGGGSTQTQ